MAGANPKNSSPSIKPSPSQPHRKSRWESGNKPAGKNLNSDNNNRPTSNKPSSTGPSNPSPKPAGFFPPPGPPAPAGPAGMVPPYNDQSGGSSLPFPDPSGLGPPPPPAYGFHMFDRRTIALADGSVRSYFALPHDYQDLPTIGRGRFDGGGGGMPHFPPGGGGMMSPEGFRRGEELYGRGGGGGGGGQNEYWNSLGLDGRDGRGPMPPPEAMLKRKFGEGDERDGRDPRDRDEFARQRQQLLQYGNPNGYPAGGPSERGGYPTGERGGHMAGTSSPFDRDQLDHGRGFDDMRATKHMRMGGEYDLSAGRGMPSSDVGSKYHNVDQQALKRAFLQFVKLIYENNAQKMKFLENGKQGSLQCLVCGRASKEFSDMHGLIMHVYGPHSGDLHVDHLGLHKALCVLMGWNYAKVPDNSKVYQSLPANEAEANTEDLILWPPLVIIHNTNTGKSKDGRMDGLGNRVMDIKLKDLGFGGGKAKSLYGKEGHLGITLVKFAPDQSGLKEAVRLAEYFEKDYHGRKGWARAQQPGRDDETNPNLVNLDEMNRENQRILYGYLATVLDFEKLDFETKKKVSIESKRELRP
ncbi:hypothetical protein ACHQM5_027518 [Ranunculus cassubicifolius]